MKTELSARAQRQHKQSIYFTVGISRFGHILIAQNSNGICAIFLGDDAATLINDLHNQFAHAELIASEHDNTQLVAEVINCIENPLHPCSLTFDNDGTAFQQQVWRALQTIPSGQTSSYQQIAAKIGKPKAIRAVANACAANKLAVLIPCHRVIRTDGKLSGYRWGLERKKALLHHEKHVQNRVCAKINA